MKKRLFMYLIYSILVSGCASKLVVTDTNADEVNASGVVVNKRVNYSVKVKDPNRMFCSKELCAKSTVSGVSMNKLLLVNAKRMIFSNASLTIETQKDHTVKKVGVTGSSGAARSLDSGSKLLDSRVERIKLRREAMEAEDEAEDD